MRSAGAPEPVIAAQRKQWIAQQPEFKPVEVFPENIAAFQVLNATAEQWETPGPFGGRLALSLVEIRAAMDGLQLPPSQETFLRVMGMVRAAREVKLQQYEAAMAAAKAR